LRKQWCFIILEAVVPAVLPMWMNPILSGIFIGVAVVVFLDVLFLLMFSADRAMLLESCLVSLGVLMVLLLALDVAFMVVLFSLDIIM